MRNTMTLRDMIADSLYDIYNAAPDDGRDLLPARVTLWDEAELDNADLARFSLQSAIGSNERGSVTGWALLALLLIAAGAFCGFASVISALLGSNVTACALMLTAIVSMLQSMRILRDTV